MIPRVKIRKADGQTGVVLPGEEGICAIIAPATSGTNNQPTPMTSPNSAVATFTSGFLATALVYMMQVAGNPVVAVKANATTNGAYGSMTLTGTGTTTPSATSATHPLDDFNVLITCTLGGTLGTGPITLTYSLDGGITTSPPVALGTATTFAIPNTGISVDFTHSSNTLVTGDTITFLTTGPRMNQTDLDNALTALLAYGGPWESVLVLGLDASATIVGDLDTTLSGIENPRGIFRFFGINSAYKASGTSEATYLSTMTSAFASAASIRGFVAADQGDMADPIWKCTMARPAALFVMARLMASEIEVDAARVSDGPLPNCTILDARNNPTHHNEDSSPGLDAIRLVTLRTIPGENGTYVCNPNVISSPGSDYVYMQHVRVMNKACTIAFQELQRLLSSGVASNAAGHIAEGDAQAFEEHVKIPMLGQLRGKVSDADFIIHRDDDISSNAGALVNADVEIVSLKYVKEFDVNSRYVRTLTRTLSVGG